MNLVKGGQGRTESDVRLDGEALGWLCVLFAVFAFVFLAGCAPRVVNGMPVIGACEINCEPTLCLELRKLRAEGDMSEADF